MEAISGEFDKVKEEFRQVYNDMDELENDICARLETSVSAPPQHITDQVGDEWSFMLNEARNLRRAGTAHELRADTLARSFDLVVTRFDSQADVLNAEITGLRESAAWRARVPRREAGKVLHMQAQQQLLPPRRP